MYTYRYNARSMNDDSYPLFSIINFVIDERNEIRHVRMVTPRYYLPHASINTLPIS